MIFNADGKVDTKTLNEIEARVFALSFLPDELNRHQREVDISLDIINSCNRNDVYQNAMAQFQSSAIKRHMDDIQGTRVLIEEVKRKYKLQ